MITRLAGKYLALLFLFVFLSACAQKKANNCVDIDENIILVNIQNGDRLQLAKLINSLAETNVKAIGVNLLLEGTKSNDSVLNNEIQRVSDRLVFASVFSKGGNTIIESPFRNVKMGLVSYSILKDSLVSSFYYNWPYKEEIYPSFPFQLLKILYPNLIDSKNFIDTEVFRIDFVGNMNCFYVFTSDQILDIPKDYWENKVVIIGYMGAEVSIDGFAIDNIDSYKTSLSKGKRVYGSVILANILASMKRKLKK